MQSNLPDQKSRFSANNIFEYSLEIAGKHKCSIAIPNGPGVGNVICYTRLIEEMARKKGSPLNILTAPLNPIVGRHKQEIDYPIWKHNPFVGKIINADDIDQDIMRKINKEKDDTCQFNHVIENLCFPFGLFPTKLRGSLFLTPAEMKWALLTSSKYKRPLIAIHPYGKTSPSPKSAWYTDRWHSLVNLFPDICFIQVGLPPSENKNLGIPFFEGTLRQTMAVIWVCDLFMGFDRSLTHIAASFEKPSLVLWDVIEKELLEHSKEPGFAGGMMLRWAYPQNRNVMLLGEKKEELLDVSAQFIFQNINSFYGKKQFSFA